MKPSQRIARQRNSEVGIFPGGDCADVRENRVSCRSIQWQYGRDRNCRLGDTVEEQMTAAFANLRAAISAAGAQPHHVVQIRVFIVGHREKYLLQVAAEAKALFGDALPASTLIPVPRLALDDMLFEIEATLFVPG